MMFIALAFGWDKGLGFGHSTVRAVGDLSVDWGVPEGEAIFEINNFAPGDSMSKDVFVVNNASTVRPVGVRGIKTAETGGLADKLLIIISVDSVEIYGIGGSKSLSQFFTESSGPDGLELVNFNPGADRTLSFKVIFNPDSIVHHYFWGSTKEVSQTKIYFGVRNRLLFIKEYFSFIEFLKSWSRTLIRSLVYALNGDRIHFVNYLKALKDVI